jgi:hypothetical protein
MPNKRHPARKFLGFWATTLLKEKLREHAIIKRTTLSVLMHDILDDYLLKFRNRKGRSLNESNFNRSKGNSSN